MKFHSKGNADNNLYAAMLAASTKALESEPYTTTKSYWSSVLASKSCGDKHFYPSRVGAQILQSQ